MIAVVHPKLNHVVLFAGVAQAGQVLLLLPVLRVRAVAVGRDAAGVASVAALKLERPAGHQVDVDVRAAKLDHQLQEVPQDQHGIVLDEVAERRTSSRWRLGERDRLTLGIVCNSVVERALHNQEVTGSNPNRCLQGRHEASLSCFFSLPHPSYISTSFIPHGGPVSTSKSRYLRVPAK